MKTTLRAAVLGLALTFATAANAGVDVTATPGTSPYSGPTPTYDFSSTIPTYTGGGIITTGTTSGLYAQPYGSSGAYFSTGPSTSSPSTIYLTTLGDIAAISLIWGSLDAYNTLFFTDASGNSLGAGYTFTGSDIAALIPGLANGDQSDPNTNPWVTFTLTGADQQLVRGIGMTSSQNAFEIDNIAITSSGVPEPSTWSLMILGIGGIGAAMRRRRRRSTNTALQFA